VITAVVVEGRSQAEVARAYSVSPGWVSKLVARYRVEGEAAFRPRSRRPNSSPSAIGAETVELILRVRKQLTEQGLDAGPHTIRWHLQQHHQLQVSGGTVSRYLTRTGMVTPQPRKRPKSSYIRFQAELPNQCWQADFTHYRLATGADAEVLSFLDDHSRFALSITAHPRITGPIVLAAFRTAVATHGVPASTLTDNGMVFTTRLAGGRGGRNGFETELHRLGITQKNSRPNHPTTCGKVERFQQTLKKWLRAHPHQPTTLTELQTLIDTFLDTYRQHRPPRSLPHPGPPAPAHQARPKATPTNNNPDTDTHWRTRTDRVDNAGSVTLRYHGRLHHIGIGRTHARTHVIMLIADRHIRILNATTGQLLRELILDPTKDYQPRGTTPHPQPQRPRTQ